ncbi:MAG: hypothetical protein ABI359_01470 [Ginsengibacter sp.]
MEIPQMNVVIGPTIKTETVSTEVNQKSAANKKKLSRNDHWMIIICGMFGLMGWIIFFSLGMVIDSSIYRTTLTTDFTWFKFLMTLLTYTPSNIAILCLVSSFTGGCASLLVIKKAQKMLGLTDQPKNQVTSKIIYMNESPFSSMIRGILVFFAFLAGVFITSSNALIAPTPQAYTQAAGIVSLLAFLVGYDPTMFNTLINLSEKIKGSN